MRDATHRSHKKRAMSWKSQLKRGLIPWNAERLVNHIVASGFEYALPQAPCSRGELFDLLDQAFVPFVKFNHSATARRVDATPGAASIQGQPRPVSRVYQGAGRFNIQGPMQQSTGGATGSPAPAAAPEPPAGPTVAQQPSSQTMVSDAARK